MALLRESSKAAGHIVDLAQALADDESDAGVRHGSALKGFARAAAEMTADLPDARARLGEALGPVGVREAAATVAAFSGLVRVADATGIQVDDPVFSATVEERASLGVDGFNSAANTTKDSTETPDDFTDAMELFR